MSTFKKGDLVVIDETYGTPPACFKEGVPVRVVQGDTPSRSVIKVEGSDVWWLKERFKLYEKPQRTCVFTPDKKYKTRDGREAIVYAVYPEQGSVHGAYKCAVWVSTVWMLDGTAVKSNDPDLMPNKRTLWVNVWRNDGEYMIRSSPIPFHNRAAAELDFKHQGREYITTLPIEIEE